MICNKKSVLRMSIKIIEQTRAKMKQGERENGVQKLDPMKRGIRGLRGVGVMNVDIKTKKR